VLDWSVQTVLKIVDEYSYNFGLFYNRYVDIILIDDYIVK